MFLDPLTSPLFVRGSVGQSVNRSSYRLLVGPDFNPVVCLLGCQVGVGQSVCRSVGLSVSRSVGQSVCRSVGQSFFEAVSFWTPLWSKGCRWERFWESWGSFGRSKGCLWGSFWGSWGAPGWSKGCLWGSFWGSWGTPGGLWQAVDPKDRRTLSPSLHFKRFWCRNGRQQVAKMEQKTVKNPFKNLSKI